MKNSQRDGAFGTTGASILLPAGIDVGYPWGQSLDQNGIIQVDSNDALEGGVQPDISIPLTLETAKSIHVDNNDVVLDFARDLLQKRLTD